jgi:hypothetical protein
MKTCPHLRCPGDDRCCGAAVFVRLHPHGEELPAGAAHVEAPVVGDHHRHHGSLIELAASQAGG